MDALEVIKRDNFTCQKCGYMNIDSVDLEVHHIDSKRNNGLENAENLIVLCSICHHYAPDEPKYFRKYVSEKIDGKILETFRKSKWSISERTKAGMMKRLSEGSIISKAPKGYKIIDKRLVIDEPNAFIVRKLFEEFISTDTSLTRLAQKYGLTTSGIIKVLNNKTYIGILKLDSGEVKGIHEPLLNVELFLKAQDKMKSKKK